MDRNVLAALITEHDRKASKRPGYNPYALAQMLAAALEAVGEVASYGPERAFARHFTPTRTNHAIARKLGLNLDVQRGRWEYATESAKGGAA